MAEVEVGSNGVQHLEEKEEFRRRRRERIAVVVITVLLVLFTAIEVHLLKVSNKLPFVNSIFFFGLMNINIVLIMLLLFLVFRNAVKMILDERRGKTGSRLKTRLVFSFVLFAIIPTLLLFSISAFYIRSSFDQWFSARVSGTLEKSLEVVRNYYENTERNASHFARKIAFSLEGQLGSDVIARKLQQARAEYGLDAVEYYSDPFAPRILSAHPDRLETVPPASLASLQRAFAGNNECKVQSVGTGELVRCSAFLGAGRGVIFADYFIPLGLASRLSEINLTYEDFKSHNPLNYPIKSTYFLILSMMTLLILFSAIWTGFHVAKRLSVPIEELAKGTEEIAHGNLEYMIPTSGTDEMARLIQSFNRMTQDLLQNKRQIESTHANLKAVNEELMHRRRYIEVLLESIQSGVVSLDENGRISMLNHAASELLGISEASLVGKPYWAIIPEKHRSEFRELLYSVYALPKPLRRELRIRAANGELLTLLVTLSVLRDENKRQLGVVAVFDDVTEIQKMERMLAWREVAKRIAHEIKNPLTPIQLSVQRLRRRYLDRISDDGTFGEATQMILNEVDALKTLVSEFSAFARLPEIRQMPEDFNQIVLDTVNVFRAAHESIRFELNLAEALSPMELDRAQLKRALINLFDNAVAAMNGSGTISVQTDQDKNQGVIRCIVADEGCGIPEGISSQLFEPYFSTKEGGTGLGLAIVQRIVADHGGFVRVTANHPKGTRFVIELPDNLVVGTRRRGPLSSIGVSLVGEEKAPQPV